MPSCYHAVMPSWCHAMLSWRHVAVSWALTDGEQRKWRGMSARKMPDSRASTFPPMYVCDHGCQRRIAHARRSETEARSGQPKERRAWSTREEKRNGSKLWATQREAGLVKHSGKTTQVPATTAFRSSVNANPVYGGEIDGPWVPRLNGNNLLKKRPSPLTREGGC